ncbi:MAG: DUF1311 domain-containing protein [Bdellovibrionales bacterium]|nr:DUF1311 domain-containing protein [Bdellovibrionales bacterium]
MRVLVLLATFLCFQQAFAGSMAGNLMKTKLDNIQKTQDKCVQGALGNDVLYACVEKSNTDLSVAMAEISAAFLGAFPEQILKLADSSKKWADYATATCDLSTAFYNQGTTSYQRIYLGCENNKIRERVLELIEIYDTYLENQ